LNAIIKKNAELNESTFCSLWTCHIKIDDCADVFINERFENDYFFNRLSNIQCNHVDIIIDKASKIFLERGMACYVYVDENNDRLERLLLHIGFAFVDTLQVLRMPLQSVVFENHNINVKRISRDSLPIWIDIFCKSFEIIEWQDEVERILERHFKKLTLLLSFLQNNNNKKIPIGCAALLDRHNLLGVYCLGTIPAFRGKGSAKKLLEFSLQLAVEEGVDSLILQTFTNEGFIRFYRKFGFDLLCKRKIYALVK
jgi:GNAT superfamily N-acetyltransferase